MARGWKIYGEVLAELRRRALKSQFELAADCQAHDRHCGLTGDRISQYENGRRDPSLRNLLVLIAVLKLTPLEQQALIRTPTLDKRLAHLNGNGHGTHRAQFLKIMGETGLLAVFAPLDAVERIICHGDRPVDAALIHAHEAVADAHAIRHLATRPGTLVDPVAKHADLLLRLLDSPMPSTQRRRLEVITVGSCAQAGMLSFAANDRPAARRYSGEARNVADESGDNTLSAATLAVASMLCSSIPSGGRGGNTRRAVELLQAAVRHDETLPWVHQWLAEELAADGNEPGFRKAADTAQRLSRPNDRSDSHGLFARYFTPVVGAEELSRSTGIGFVRLGRPDEAVAALVAALGRVGPRGRAIVIAEVAAARVLQGEAEKACRGLLHAFELAREAGYPMGIERIRGVRDRFDPRWDDLVCVRELDDRLRLAA